MGGLLLLLLYLASDSPGGYRAFSDEWAITITGFKALSIGFLILFLGNLLFIAPYQLWREATTELEVVNASVGSKSEVPPTEINEGSLGAYIRGFPTVRLLNEKIAERMDLPLLKEREIGAFSYAESAVALGVTTLAQLDKLLKDDETLILRAAPYLIPEKGIRPTFCLSVLFTVIGGRMGADEYWERIKSLKHTSSPRGWADNAEHTYKEITAY
ncbi:hypothetical protein CHN51_02170 [Sphingorhabdus sp. YGSMI21]|nr:hypothetical protein CHN51_02170 [Sphingorhabdus sp. YGSMI21]